MRTAIILSVAASLAQASPVSQKPAPATDPVCIVGAGAAGLAAAKTLEDKGIKAVIFEKRPEVGGKCQAYYEK
jgi:cation diffusion facilitator CzcD-associated flavoprotein CzcO